MSEKDSSTIPPFYRFYFKWSDPAVCIWAAGLDFFTPAFFWNAFVPAAYITPQVPYYNFALEQLGGALLMLAFIDIVLLRYTEDVRVWKILQMAVLIYDFSLLYSNYSALAVQHRLSFADLRVEDIGGIFITAQAVVVRSAFLLGVGVKEDKAATKKA